MNPRLPELAAVFGRLGVTAVGGPAAHIAMTRDEVVRRRRWLDEAELLDVVGMANLVPGPTSTEVVMHVGRVRAGRAGLVVAGVAFILPAAVLVGVLAWLYDRYGAEPAVEDLLYGVKPVVLAIVVDALLGLARTAVSGVLTGALVVAATVAFVAGVDDLAVLVLAAAVTAAWSGRQRAARGLAVVLAPFGPAASAAADPSLWELARVFLRIGAVLFGSGYVLLAFLQHDLVDVRGWLTDEQLLDAVAIGQVTPGPVFTTATFVGFLVAGAPGAAVATVAIFLPAFVFVLLTGGLVPRIRRSPVAAAALDGVNAAAVGLMIGVCLVLAGDAVVDPFSAGIALTAFVGLRRWRPNPAWVVLAGLAVGTIRTLTW